MRLPENSSASLLPPSSSEPMEQPLAFKKYHQKPLPSFYNYLPGKRISEDTRIRILAQNSGYVSSYFFQLAKTWDQGNRRTREKILQDFIAQNANKTGPQLEVEFANGASLFLTRISAWLRLTYLVGYNISLQLQAITVFISASGGHRFLAEFLEVGGVLTVLELLGLPQIREPDRAEAMRLLINIATAGRSYREFICESYGIRAVADCLARTTSDIVADYAKNLLFQLGTGNPKFLTQVYKVLLSLVSQQMTPLSQQMGAQTLRLLIPSVQNLHRNVIDASLSLLKNSKVQVQYEGCELLKELVKRPNLLDLVLLQLITVLKMVTEDGDDAIEFDIHKKSEKKSEWSSILNGGAKEDNTRVRADTLLATYVQQAHCAKLLGYFAATSKAMAKRMLHFQVVSGLLNTLANVNHSESQRHAASTLMFLADHYDVQIGDYMGPPFWYSMQERPDTFYRELTREQIRQLRNTNLNSNLETTASNNSLDEGNAYQDKDDDEAAQRAAKRDQDVANDNTDTETHQLNKSIGGTTSNKTATQLVAETLIAPKKEQELIKTMFKPYSLAINKNTYAGSKFTQGENVDTNEKFNTELEKQKKKKIFKDHAARDEAQLVISSQIQTHMDNLLHDKDLFKKTTKRNNNNNNEAAAAVSNAEVDEAATNAKREIKEIKIRMNTDYSSSSGSSNSAPSAADQVPSTLLERNNTTRRRSLGGASMLPAPTEEEDAE